MIKLEINPLCYVLILFAVLHGFIYELLLLFLIVIIHEMGHLSMALSLGWRLSKVELLPFGGVVEVEEHGNRSPWEEGWVIVAGPAMNGVMIIVAFLFLQWGWWSLPFAYQFIEYNLIILVFNLLPIWPLDGGKLMQLLLSFALPYKQAIRHSLLMSGGCFLFYLIATALFFPLYFSLWVMGLFLLISQWLEWRQAPYQFMRFLLSKYQRSRANNGPAGEKVISLALDGEERLLETVEKMYRHRYHYFCVVDKSGKVVQVISEQELLHHFFHSEHRDKMVGKLL